MRFLLFLILIGAAFGVGYYVGTGGSINAFFKSDFLKKDVPAIVSDEKIERKSSDSATEIKSSVAVARDIVGTWKSTDDAKFTREFAADSTVVDTYQGDEAATMQGMWKVFTNQDGEAAPFPLQEGMVYLRISTPEEVLFFTIPKISPDSLELTYLGGGGTLRLTRIR